MDRALLDHLSEHAQGHVLAPTLTASEQAAARRQYAELTESIEDPIDFARLPSWFAGVDYLRRHHVAHALDGHLRHVDRARSPGSFA